MTVKYTSAAAVALVVLLAACSPGPSSDSAEGSGVSQQSGTATSPADAPPAGFPDFSAFTESGEQFAQQFVPRVQGFAFSTPSGLICGSNAYPEPEFEHVDCRGPIPSQGAGDWSIGAGFLQSGTIEPLSNDPDFAADKKRPPPVLPPLHKVTSLDGVAVCGIDEDGTVGCRVDDHGFVITATETRVF